jgi:ABC-type glycerol-3-phosphate transport system substrate-binding protein
MAMKRTWVLWILASAVMLGLLIFLLWPPANGGTLVTLVVREGLEAEGLSRLAEEYGRERNVAVRVERLGRENYEANVLTDLTSARPSYDVVFLPGTLVAEMADQGAVAPIKEVASDDLNDFLDVVRYRGEVFALPTDVSTFYLVYREDLLQWVPDTWNGIVARNGVPLKEGARTRYAFAFACRPGEELPKMFYPILWSSGGFLIEGDRIGLDTPEGVAAAELFRVLTKTAGFPADANTWEVGRILDELNKGELASTAPQWNAVYPLVKERPGLVGENSKATVIPAVARQDGARSRVNFMQFWTLTKSSRSRMPKEANDLILYITSRAAAERYARAWKGTPARRSVLDSQEVRKSRPDFALLSVSLTGAKAEPSVPYYAKMHRVMNDQLSLLLSDRKGPAEAMRDAARAIKELDSGSR